MNDPFALTEESIARAVKAHDALMLHCADARLRREWERVRREAPSQDDYTFNLFDGPQAGTDGYEPSQTAPTHDKALWWALAAVCGLLMWSAAIGAAVGIVKKVREPAGMACFCIIIATVAVVARWPR